MNREVKAIEICIHWKQDVGSSTTSGALQDLFDEDIETLIAEIEKEKLQRSLENEKRLQKN